MRITSMRLVAAIVVTSLTVTGLAPLAQAQPIKEPVESTPLEQAETTAPVSPVEPTLAQVQQPTPPAPPMQPAQPDLFQETLKAQQRSADRKQAIYETGAVVTNVFLIPGRAITCALGAGVGIAVLALTLGTGYKTAAGAFDEGCGGKWVVNGDDLKPEGSRAFEWER